jgi:hypothetical protein
MRPVLLIASGAYVVEELAAEFGALPSALLPVGMRRLYQQQLQFVKDFDGEVVLSLPKDYKLTQGDRNILSGAGVSVVNVEPKVPLHLSILSVLEQIGFDRNIHILHGDTLFISNDQFINETDIFTIALAQQAVVWGAYLQEAGGNIKFFRTIAGAESDDYVLSGYFAFSNGPRIFQALGLAASFLDALTIYSLTGVLRPRVIKGWADFGHTANYYEAKRVMLTARSFNNIQVENRILTKRSTNEVKLEHEASWYEGVPNCLKLHLPQFLGRETDEHGLRGYKLSYLPYPTLAELWVFGRLKSRDWSSILDSCRSVLEDFQCTSALLGEGAAKTMNSKIISELVQEKSRSRVETFFRSRNWDMDKEWRFFGRRLPSVSKMLDQLILVAGQLNHTDVCVVHGDFCFSNIVYDFRGRSIRCYDPRGTLNGKDSTLFGSPIYEVAKLAHSAVGLYDNIVAGHASVSIISQNCTLEVGIEDIHTELGGKFLEMRFGCVSASDPRVVANMILLFFSMLPLHSDSVERQSCLFVNALRLYSDYSSHIS